MDDCFFFLSKRKVCTLSHRGTHIWQLIRLQRGHSPTNLITINGWLCFFLSKRKVCALSHRDTHMATDTTATKALSHKFNYRVAVAASSQRKTMTIKVISLTCTAGRQAVRPTQQHMQRHAWNTTRCCCYYFPTIIATIVAVVVWCSPFHYNCNYLQRLKWY